MKTDLLSTIEKSKDYTLAVAEAMPSNFYGFKPTEGVWSFNELMNHLAYGIQWWEHNFIKRTETKWNPPSNKTTKEETIEFVQKCYDGLTRTIESEKASEETLKGLWATLDHITHHRGQAILHLRLIGIAAPEYAF
jgi:uncharacterized damage-inducible protein DinB